MISIVLSTEMPKVWAAASCNPTFCRAADRRLGESSVVTVNAGHHGVGQRK